MDRSSELTSALELHSAAVDAVLATAARIPSSEWREPRDEGKWSPAEVLAHLVSTYDVVTGELRGGNGMKIRTRTWQRWILRLTVLRRILSGDGFPKGAVAPRETRPGMALDREESLSLFRQRAAEFEEAARGARPGQKITHAYFGSAPVAHGVVLCTRHLQHHSAQLGSRR